MALVEVRGLSLISDLLRRVSSNRFEIFTTVSSDGFETARIEIKKIIRLRNYKYVEMNW